MMWVPTPSAFPHRLSPDTIFTALLWFCIFEMIYCRATLAECPDSTARPGFLSAHPSGCEQVSHLPGYQIPGPGIWIRLIPDLGLFQQKHLKFVLNSQFCLWFLSKHDEMCKDFCSTWCCKKFNFFASVIFFKLDAKLYFFFSFGDGSVRSQMAKIDGIHKPCKLS